MKISDLVIENNEEQVQEGPLGAIGRGLAKGVGGLAKGAGMVAGVGRGLKTAYQKGKATSAANIAGDVPPPQKKQDPEAQAAYDKEYARLTTPQQGTNEPAVQQPTQQQRNEPTMSQQPAAKPSPNRSFGQGTPMSTNTRPTPGAAATLDPKSKETLSQGLAKLAQGIKDNDLSSAKIKSDINALVKQLIDDNPNIVRGTESVQHRGKMVKESWDLFQPRKKAS